MSDHVETVRETLMKAYDAAEAATPPPPRPQRPDTPARNGDNRDPDVPSRVTERGNGAGDPKSEISPETSPATISEPRQSEVDRPRDQFGRFMSATPEGPPAGSTEPREPAPREIRETPDQPEAEWPEQDDGPAILAPQSWSAAVRDHWRSLPRPVQEEVVRREREAAVAIQQRAEQVNELNPLAEVIRPYRQKLALRGVSPAAAVEQVLAVQDLLDRDPVSGIVHISKVYGVDLRQFAAAFQSAQQPQDPAVRQLTERLNQQDQLIQGWQQAAQQQERTRIDAEVQAFAADTRQYPYFEHVRQRMAELMATGGATSLAQAYTLACADNPQVTEAIRDNERRAANRERNSHDRQAADRARRAAVSVSGAPGGRGGQTKAPEPKTVRGSVAAAWDQLGYEA